MDELAAGLDLWVEFSSFNISQSGRAGVYSVLARRRWAGLFPWQRRECFMGFWGVSQAGRARGGGRGGRERRGNAGAPKSVSVGGSSKRGVGVLACAERVLVPGRGGGRRALTRYKVRTTGYGWLRVRVDRMG